jgi:hypothetical protein
VAYPTALVITLVVEVPIYLAVFAVARLLPGWRGLSGAAGVNLLTHPVLWLVVSAHPGWLAPAEVGVCLVEAALLWLLARRRDAGLLLLAAIVANAASVITGIVLNGIVLNGLR